MPKGAPAEEARDERAAVRTPHRAAVDAFLAHAIPATPGLVGLHVGSGPSATPRGDYRPSDKQLWFDVDVNATCSVRADVTRLPFPNRIFDLVRATECLYSVFDVVDALKECKRVLKPTGMLIATCPFRLAFPIDQTDVMRLTPYGWAHALGRAGFQEVKVTNLEGQSGYGLVAR